MIVSAPALLHAHCGSPRVDECSDTPGVCWVCAGECVRSMPRLDWMGASYTGQNRVRAPESQIVCEPCVWVGARSSPVPGRPPKEGKTAGGNFRNYSHLLDGATYVNASKGEKPAILAFLRRRKTGQWFAAIAESGQKHVVSGCPVNPAGTHPGRVAFEEDLIDLPRDDPDLVLVDHVAATLTAGATKEEVLRGDYGPGAWARCRISIMAFEALHAGKRASRWFRLAVFLAQRDEAQFAERMAAEKAARDAAKESRGKAERGARRAAARRDGASTTGAAPRVPGHAELQRAEALGSDHREDASGGAHEQQPGRVVDRHESNAAAQRAKRGQLSLL